VCPPQVLKDCKFWTYGGHCPIWHARLLVLAVRFGLNGLPHVGRSVQLVRPQSLAGSTPGETPPFLDRPASDGGADEDCASESVRRRRLTRERAFPDIRGALPRHFGPWARYWAENRRAFGVDDRRRRFRCRRYGQVLRGCSTYQEPVCSAGPCRASRRPWPRSDGDFSPHPPGCTLMHQLCSKDHYEGELG